MTILWRALAILSLALGLAGVFLPVLPTVPFVLLAAAAASKGWPWLDRRLLEHEDYGPLIMRWRERRAIPRRAKWLATLGMAGSSALVWLAALPAWLQYSLPVLLLGVAVWIWSRPED